MLDIGLSIFLVLSGISDDARLLANLPNWAIGSLLWISEHRHRHVHDGLPLAHPLELLPIDALLWRDPYALASR